MGAELGIRTCHASRMQMTLFNFSIPGWSPIYGRCIWSVPSV